MSWVGPRPTSCQVCRREFKSGHHFVDGRLLNGQWGILCIQCHNELGIRLGIGRGQVYSWQTREKLTGQIPAQ